MAATLLGTLGEYVFSGVPSNATWDLIKLVWVRWQSKGWEDLYLDAFQLALERERPFLEKYAHEGDISLDRERLLDVLKQQLIASPETTAYTKLIDDRFLANLAEKMDQSNILVIGGHNLTPADYAHLVKNIVKHARELFRDAVRSDEDGFKRMLQEVAEETLGSSEETRRQVRELVLFLGDRFDLIISRLDLQSDTLENIQRDIRILLQKTPIQAGFGKHNKFPIKLFLSSPGDVNEERKIVIQVCDQLRLDPLLNEFVQLEVIAWDKPGMNVPMTANTTPQNDVNVTLPKPSECEIVIVIFWARMGTPLPAEIVRADGSRYLSGTQWEYEDALQAAKRNPGKPEILIYRRSEEPIISMRDAEREEKFKQLQLVDEFFTKFRDADGASLQGYNQYKTLDEFRGNLDIHLRKIIYRLLMNWAGLDSAVELQQDILVRPKHPMPRPVWTRSPFPGLRPFTPEDAPIFFGRERETEVLLNLVHQNRFTVVAGASGSGKSSLVWAGVAPRMQDDFLILRFTPGEIGDNPFISLATQLKLHLQQSTWTPRSIAAQLELHPAILDNLCKSALPDGKKEILLFIDQFEEFFTLVKDEWRATFVDMIANVRNAKHFRIITTIRSDFYHRCLDWPSLAEMAEKGHFPLSTPRMVALYEMIVRPATLAGLGIETGLVQTILDDTGSESGALALLAYTLDELYHLGKESRTLSYDGYNSLLGVQGAIGRRAEATFVGLDIPVQQELANVFRELVEVDERGTATRQRVLLTRFTSLEASKLINAFVDSRLLLTYSNNNNEPTVEVAHEAIFRSWDRLKLWIEEARDDLILLRQMRNAAMQWESHGRNRDFLWLGERDQMMQAMLARLKPRLTDLEMAFSKSEHEHLIDEINNSTTTNARRSQIGERLSVIGDRRIGVGILPSGIPDIAWCAVPGGIKEFQDNLFNLQPFYVSKYLITYEQFDVFISSEDEYKNDTWWETLTDEYKFQNIEAQNNKLKNHPREKVSWYQAVAFCKWLTAKYRSSSEPLSPPIPPLLWQLIHSGEWDIRLPSEWEYERVVTGSNEDYLYPWGKDWLPDRANTSEAVIGRTTAVGMYPLGVSSTGAMDLAGNVWEWCLNEYRRPSHIDLSGEEARALRGGSFSRNQEDALVTARNFDDPAFVYPSFGFRICAAPQENLIAQLRKTD